MHHRPHASTPTQPLAESVRDADVVIVATNHSEFETPDARADHSLVTDECLFVDPWNTFGTSQVFVYAAEARLLSGRRNGAAAAPRRRRRRSIRSRPPRTAMTRVLVTGGAGTIGSAVVRRLLRDPRFEVRVADHRPAPDWMSQGCQVFEGDLRQLDVAERALDGCSHVIHLAAIVGGIANFHKLPFTLFEVNNALTGTIVHAAIEQDIERFTYVSSSMVFENATEYPTTEGHVRVCPAPWSAYGFSKLAGEVYTRAAHDQHGLRYTICRPFNAYGPGELPDRDEPGIAHAVPDLIAKVLSGSGRCRSSARVSRRGR